MVEVSEIVTKTDEVKILQKKDTARVPTTVTADQPQADKLLKFSIENILRPEFGVKNVENLNSSTTTTTTTTTAAEEKSTTANSETVWPAWVYCTRYSDRPSSGRSKYLRETLDHL
ncbi:segmentation polarity homeobox protein engrailed-like isoform X1 [Rhodnius prolixus]|uniref:segmentation polarity homeobox protein engrailed-like isoform X1 n=1 Tax=Rhodnius prolixus TaxID=13249 RepID=UPI003D189DE8